MYAVDESVVFFWQSRSFLRWHANLLVIIKIYFPRRRWMQPCRKRTQLKCSKDMVFLIHRLSPMHVLRTFFSAICSFPTMFVDTETFNSILKWHIQTVFFLSFICNLKNDEKKQSNPLGLRKLNTQCRQCLKMLFQASGMRIQFYLLLNNISHLAKCVTAAGDISNAWWYHSYR